MLKTPYLDKYQEGSKDDIAILTQLEIPKGI
jgi:hypothetical protein